MTQTPNFLENNAILISLEIGKWSGRRSDDQVAQEVAQNKNATPAAIRVSKRMLPRQALEPVITVANAARKYFKTHTVSWGDEGKRLLPIKKYDEFKAAMDAFEIQFGDSKVSVLKDYVYWKQKAEGELGTMYNEDEYPDTDSLAEMMYIRMTAEPVPSSNHLVVRLGKSQLDSLKKQLDKENADRASKASNSLYERLESAITTVQEKMSDDKTRGIRQSVLDSLTDVVEVVPTLNFMGDDNLAKTCEKIRELLDNVKAEELRKNDKEYDEKKANEVKSKLDEMRDQMSGAF